jgi:hypothetical protein
MTITDPPSPGNMATELVAIADLLKEARTRVQNLDFEKWPEFEKEVTAFARHVEDDEKEADRLVKRMDSVLDREEY